MKKDRSPLQALASKLYRDHKQTFELISSRQTTSPFELAVLRVFGPPQQSGKTVRIGNRQFVYTGSGNSTVNFFPLSWHEALDAMSGEWKGCENWWAGYPLALWIELKPGDDKARGYLALTAEVGPLSDQTLRQALIAQISAAAAEKKLQRIRFPSDVSKRNSLYSRFFRHNVIALEKNQSPREIEDKLIELVNSFWAEMDCVADALSLFARTRHL